MIYSALCFVSFEQVENRNFNRSENKKKIDTNTLTTFKKEKKNQNPSTKVLIEIPISNCLVKIA